MLVTDIRIANLRTYTWIHTEPRRLSDPACVREIPCDVMLLSNVEADHAISSQKLTTIKIMNTS